MRRLLTLGCWVLAVLLLGGCEREHLYYGSKENALVRVNIDWSETQWEPNGASVYAYDAQTGKLYKRFDPFSNPHEGYISLPVGIYNLVIFNNTPAEFADHLVFLGDDDWSTFRTEANIDTKAYARSNAATAVASSSRANDTFASEPDTFAVARYERLEVTQEMAHRYYYDIDKAKGGEEMASITVTPHKVIPVFNIKVHVKGLKYAKPPVYAYMRGLAKGYYMGLGCNTADPCTHAFILNNRQWDEGSTKDGTISASFNTFGVIPEGVTRADGNSNQVILDIDFVLTDGQSHPVSVDVTDAIESVELDIGTEVEIKLTLKLEIDVELPEAIGGDDPDDPEGGGGFAPDVSDWEEEEIDFPM